MKKGFTLIELMGVLILIAAIAAISSVVITNIIVDSKDKAYDATIHNIKSAAKNYVNSGNDTATCVNIETLQTKGFLEKDIKNPKTEDKITGSIKIENNKYTYQSNNC